jgi:hypothetical protein
LRENRQTRIEGPDGGQACGARQRDACWRHVGCLLACLDSIGCSMPLDTDQWQGPSCRAASAAVTTRTVPSWRGRARTLSLLGIGVPATVGQPATVQPCSHACHAHAPHAHDGAQRRFAQGRQERSWRHILRDGMRSASVECVSEADWARLPTGLRCGIAREERERSTARPLPWCVSRTDERGRS